MPCQLGAGFIRRTDKSDKWLFEAAVQIWFYGYIIKFSTLLSFQQLHRNVDATLFKKIFNSDHCLHHLLPPVKSLPMQLRPGGELPVCKYTTFKQGACLVIMIEYTFIAFILSYSLLFTAYYCVLLSLYPCVSVMWKLNVTYLFTVL